MSRRTKHLIELRNVSCTRTETGISSSVHNVSVELTPGSITLFTGAPGCGKNLILRLLGLLESPDTGEIIFESNRLPKMDPANLIGLRDTLFGYIFPTPFLLPGFSVMENIAMPLFKVHNMSPKQAQTRTEMLMEHVGLEDFSSLKIDKLSLGLQLRVGLARALGSLPLVLIVEEPDLVMQGVELEAFRDLLHLSALEFNCAVAMSASPGILVRPRERRVECVAGKIVCDVTP